MVSVLLKFLKFRPNLSLLGILELCPQRDDSSPFLTMLFLHLHGMHPLEQARKPPYVPVCFEASLTQLSIFQG